MEPIFLLLIFIQHPPLHRSLLILLLLFNLLQVPAFWTCWKWWSRLSPRLKKLL